VQLIESRHVQEVISYNMRRVEQRAHQRRLRIKLLLELGKKKAPHQKVRRSS